MATVLPTEQDEAYARFRDNADAVAANPEAASALNLRRAASYLSHRLSSIQHRAWSRGERVDADIVHSYRVEMEWYERLARAKERE